MIMLTTDALPLRLDAHGAIRVGGTRVTLDFVVEAFHLGCSPEEIAARFPTLQVADVYAALWYYLRHRAEIDVYLADRERQATASRSEYEARWPAGKLRAHLEARRSGQEVAGPR